MPVLTLVQGGSPAINHGTPAVPDRDLSGYFEYALLATWFALTVVVLIRTF